jgi:hypothetical protein
MSGLTDDERRVLREYRDTSLTKIQKTIRKRGDNTSLLRYTNWLLNNVLFPLNFFNPSSHPSFKDDDDKSKYDELMGILKEVRDRYFEEGKKIGPIDLVLFMCGFEPVAVMPERYEQMEDGTSIGPMLEKTTDDHKMNFSELQKKGREFLDKLLSFGPFNKHLDHINQNKIPSNQPHRVVMLKFTGITSNENFKHIIDQLFITPDETAKPQFTNPDNSLYMSELKTKRVMKLFGFSEEKINDIWSGLTPPSSSRMHSVRPRSATPSPSPSASTSSSTSTSRRPSNRPRSATSSLYRRQNEETDTPRGGRRTSRRKQTKSRNPRKRKSTTKQRRRKSVKHRKS